MSKQKTKPTGPPRPRHLSDADRAALAGQHRHDQAMMLLTGRVGPLAVAPFATDVAALAYIVHLAYRRARAPGNMLSGRPAYEAAETLLNRVLSVAVGVGSLREFGHTLFERLGLSIAELHARDALWWLQVLQAHGTRWHSLVQPVVLTEACTGARLLDELLWELADEPIDTDPTTTDAEEAVP